MPEVQMDIEQFYAADERRRRSEEIELGTDWHDADGARYELSWVADTGELYVMREPYVPMTEDPFGDVYRSAVPTGAVTVAVVGWVAERDAMEELLDGWESAMPQGDSIAWLAERLRSRGIPKQPPAG
ncbi:MAG TPA: hypothetical protein VMR97_07480 [Acidimicrobiales bacterium]|nr:hypothetical protein [Acidimicrobiales bacterium]